ncbi:helix-turn-helix domain-containing protein [Gaoshiqia sp. Z1-71]|uniref:helix-turn-helix domain-containing protein n=1 Tax=Gaoshiqia hydrogeniformans TaxID=3290090 RepID=UPI003BF7F964
MSCFFLLKNVHFLWILSKLLGGCAPDYPGATPKRFSSIVRLNSIIRYNQKNQSISDMAFDGGYFDQPHFNKDFKLFTGQTPTDFFRSASFW